MTTRRPLLALGLALVALLCLVATASAAAPAPAFLVDSVAQPTNFAPRDGSGNDTYVITVTNIGAEPTDGSAIVITDALPPGLTATSIEFFWSREENPLNSSLCTTAPVRCTLPASLQASLGPLQPGDVLQLVVGVAVGRSAAAGPITNSVTVTGGAAAGASASSQNAIAAEPAPFGLAGFAVAATDAGGEPATQAAGHPYALTTTLHFATKLDAEGYATPVEDPRNIAVDLPPGLIGNPQAATRCSLADFRGAGCPRDSQIGVALVDLNHGSDKMMTSLYDLEPSPGNAAQIGFNTPLGASVSFSQAASIRTGTDYGVRILNAGTPTQSIRGFSITVWGVPADPSHDAQRGTNCVIGFGCIGGLSAGSPPRPFLTLPSFCSASPITFGATVNSWLAPETEYTASAQLPAPTGCNGVRFDPTIEARPTTGQADSPSGLDLSVHLPQKQSEEDPAGTSQANLRDAVVSLAAGLRINPSGANGLASCSEAQIALSSPAPGTCPDGSKIGTVSLETPLLDHPLPGALYVGAPLCAPCTPSDSASGRMLRLFIQVDDPQTGVVVKLPGTVSIDQATGQLTSSFRENPQLPFENLHVHLFGGAEGPLRTPSVCGAYRSSSVLTPWSAPESGPPAEPSDEFTIAGSCSGSESSEPDSPSFDAGTEAPQAGQFSPFAFKLTRVDGSQELSKIETVLPPGLTGKLAGVGECPESALAAAASKSGREEQAGASCPASSEVGKVEVGAGAGPDPYYTTGHAYLAGPYKGAPISLVTVVPAVAGPFDLGTVVTRIALHVDPQTTQITAVSDPLPRIIDGIPLDIRSIALKLDRPQFSLNPTSCNPLSIGGAATSVFGQSAPLSQRFQVGGCNALPFKPKLALRLEGATKRSGFPGLKAVLTMPPGSANVAAARVTLPHSSFVANAHLDKTCSHPQLESGSCPARSVYGHAKAWSPLLDAPLEGNVYLVTGFGYELPALVADLQGQIEVHLVGKIDSGREDGIRNSFEMVPDAPVSKFVLEMAGGKKSLIENSQDLCAKHTRRKALAEFTGQNGKVADLEPEVKNSCKHKRTGHGKRNGHRKRRRSA